ncbi:MAG TPA: DUF4214 domain-containing protein [Ramlibacter sp.]|nr:DUF4214 domain-containing protein [Ramlibacter sp.]
MTEIGPGERLTPPYSSICYISCEWSDGTRTRASGVVIGVNDVLTAHHVVFDATKGGYATSITISPAADTYPFLVQPYGAYTDVGVIYARTADWDPSGDQLLFDDESQYDLAVLGLRSAIGQVTGWLPVSNSPTDFWGTINGYPAAGGGQMEEVAYADASTLYSTFDLQANLGPGASGGPLLRTDPSGTSVAGVLSGGGSGTSTYAGLYGAGNWNWLQDALAANNLVLDGASAPSNGTLDPSSTGVITYFGTALDDLLRGTSANETFLGGAGLDAAAYTGTRASHVMARTPWGVTVTDTQASRDGMDGLAGVERIVFSDMAVNLQIGAAAQAITPVELRLLQELYVAFFDRVPEADGLAFWIGRVQAGQSIASIADAFYAAALLYPSLTGYTAGMTHADFVQTIYRNVLGRTEGADLEGLAYWTNGLETGTQTRGSLVTAILHSAHTFKGDATWGWVADLLDNKALVAQRFAVELGLNYDTPEASIAHGMQIADAITATDTAAAIALIGVNDGFSTFG